MGIYYWGDINGRVWNAQDWDDFKNLGCEEDDAQEYFYHVCGCEVDDLDKVWCQNCFENMEAHISQVEDYTEGDLLYYQSETINYIFHVKNLKNLKARLLSSEFCLGKYEMPMSEFINLESIVFKNNLDYDFEYMEDAKEAKKLVEKYFEVGDKNKFFLSDLEIYYGLIMMYYSYQHKVIFSSAIYKSMKKIQKKRFRMKIHKARKEFEKIPRYLLGLQILEFFRRNPDADECHFTVEN